MLFRTFALNEDAFARECDARFIFPSKPFRDVYARLLHEIEAGSDALLLIGAPGVGKTTLLRQLGENLEAWRWVVRWGAVHVPVSQTAVNPPGGNPGGEAGGEAEKPAAGSPPRPTAVIVDAADDLSDAALQQICRSAMNHRPAEVLLLAGTEALVDKLACSPHGFAFRLTRMRCLPAEDIPAYVRHRLTAAGSPGCDVFTPQALDVLANYSRGIPGTINRMAVASLLLANVEGLKRVDSDLVHEAAGDLGIGGSARTAKGPAVSPSGRLKDSVDGRTLAVPGEAANPVIPHDPAVDRLPALRRWRLGAAGVTGAAVLALSVAYIWKQPSSWLSPDVVASSPQQAPDPGADVATTESVSIASREAGSFSAPMDLRGPLKETAKSASAAPVAGSEASALAFEEAGAGPAEEFLPSTELLDDALVEGDTLAARGDIAAARLYYALAAQHGSSEATRKLAQSYDPVFLQGAQVRGLRPDVDKAMGGYAAAAALGDREAADRLTVLRHKMGAAAADAVRAPAGQ